MTVKYVTGDHFVYTSDSQNATISMAQFSNWISKGDSVDVTGYNPGNTAFDLTNDVPNAPTGVSASYDSTSGDVTVSFTKPTNPDVAGYQLLRAPVTNGKVGDYTVDSSATRSGTKFTDPTPATGTYSYEVQAKNDNDDWSPGRTRRRRRFRLLLTRPLRR